MNFQIVNVKSPNSVSNICAFTAFQAADALTNLHVALDHYKEQLDDLQMSQWRLAVAVKQENYMVTES